MLFSLCYHYIRPPDDPFPKLLGASESGFREQLDALEKRFQFVSPERFRKALLEGEALPGEKPGLLLTFDDGLRDHFRAAQILSERGLRGIFFAPTCVLEGEPPNPTVLHYAFSLYPIRQVLDVFEKEAGFSMEYRPGKESGWDLIGRVKDAVKYRLSPENARDTLLTLFRDLLLPKLPEGLRTMHVDGEDLVRMQEMGHEIGAHSHTHLSVGASELDEGDFEREILAPRRRLNALLEREVRAFSYPWGQIQDRFGDEAMARRAPEYDLAFATEEKPISSAAERLSLGRWCPMSDDDGASLIEKLLAGASAASSGRR